MKKIKLAVLGGGTGMSQLLKGLKKLPFDLSAIVSVCDDGKSTGRLREEFQMPAVGDIRKVLISMSENEDDVEKLFDYRFKTSSDLDGHALGNLLLTGANEITGNMSDGIELLNSLLKLKGNVLPLTEDNVTLMGLMGDGSVVEGEHNITEDKNYIKDVYYKEKPEVNPEVIKVIKEADAIVLSMGSLFTSILPNLICEEVQTAIEQSKAKIIYVCNVMTQPGETDGFSVSDHVNLLNKYLGKRKVDTVVVNTGQIEPFIVTKYANEEQKDLVEVDYDNLKDINLISNTYASIENGTIRHSAIKVAVDLFSYLID
ncbi:MAG: YvcK family protein [Bacilli bacterium]|nr:YvcK family protein [Bacilli bacterium]